VTATSITDERTVRAARHMRRPLATIALVVGIVATLLPSGVTGGAYLLRQFANPFASIPMGPDHGFNAPLQVYGGLDLFDLVGVDAEWTAAFASLVSLPLWYWFWRRSAMPAARPIGLTASLATASGLFGLAQFVSHGHVIGVAGGLFWVHVAAALCFAAAFAFAPPPRAAL
jgi:hypothetical protein